MKCCNITQVHHVALCEDAGRGDSPARLAVLQELVLVKSGEAFDPPEWFELVPPGAFDAVDGRKFVNDDPEAVVKLFNDGMQGNRVDLPIDYEHASEIKAPKGEEAPAAGWITELRVNEKRGIDARSSWTDRGSSSLRSKDYRYISPAFLHDAQGHVKRIVSAGLTNRPALHQLKALANNAGAPRMENSNMDPEKRKALCKALGLAETATDQELVDAQGKMAAQVATLSTERAGLETQLATARAQAATPSLDKFVPRPEYDAALQRATAAEQKIAADAEQALKDKATALVEQAVKDKKITPAQKDFYLSVCSSADGIKKFTDFVGVTPPIVGGGLPPGTPPPQGGNSGAPTADQLAIAARCGFAGDAAVAIFKS